MADDVNNLVLEHLRVIRAGLRDVRDTMLEQGNRLTRMEIGLAGLRRDQGTDAGGAAELGLRLDRMADTVRRIENRLDLVD